MKKIMNDAEYIKEMLHRSGIPYIEKEATETTDHKLILGFDEKGRLNW